MEAGRKSLPLSCLLKADDLEGDFGWALMNIWKAMIHIYSDYDLSYGILLLHALFITPIPHSEGSTCRVPPFLTHLAIHFSNIRRDERNFPFMVSSFCLLVLSVCPYTISQNP